MNNILSGLTARDFISFIFLDENKSYYNYDLFTFRHTSTNHFVKEEIINT